MGYLKYGASCFIEVIKYNNIGFDRKVVEDKDSKEDGKKMITNSEKKASKNKAQRKGKRDAMVLSLIAVSGFSAPMSASILVLRLFASAFTSVLVPRLSAAVLVSSAAIPGTFVVMPKSSIAIPRLSAVMLGLSAVLSKLSTSVSGSIPMLEFSAPVIFSAFAPMPRSVSLSMSLLCTLVFWSSPLLFPILFLPKT